MKYLYVVFPICLFMVIQLIFAYGVWETDPSLWSDHLRGFSAFVGFISLVAGVGLAYEYYERKK